GCGIRHRARRSDRRWSRRYMPTGAEWYPPVRTAERFAESFRADSRCCSGTRFRPAETGRRPASRLPRFLTVLPCRAEANKQFPEHLSRPCALFAWDPDRLPPEEKHSLFEGRVEPKAPRRV